MHALKDSLSSIVGAERVLQQAISRPGYHGGVLLFYDQDTGWWNAAIHDVPLARTGQVYQLWFLTPHGIIPGPELHPDGVRPTFVTFRLPARAGDVVAARLTVEPIAGPDDRPVGVELARLSF